MIALRAVDVVQPDVMYMGGLSRTLKVAEMAAKAGIPCTPHAANLSLVTMCTMHFLKAIPNAGKYLELSIEGLDYYPWQDGLFLGDPYRVEDGKVTVPDAPGWGIEINPAWLERAAHRVERGGIGEAHDETALLRAERRAAAADRAHDRPGRVHRGLCRHSARHELRHPRRATSRVGRRRAPGFWRGRCQASPRPSAQYIMEVAPGGGSTTPEPDAEAEAALFVVEGTLSLSIAGKTHLLEAGGFAYVPPGTAWTVNNASRANVVFHWFRKAYEAVPGLEKPDPIIIASERDIAPNAMPDTEGRWATTRFVDPADLRHDMHITIVTLEPGGMIPFEETHVMEHGLYVLEGKGVYLLNKDWVEVEAGDFMWLRAFCPQACYAGGPGKFRYLLYKDVNRHPKLRLGISLS